jgi:hypothetical protein
MFWQIVSNLFTSTSQELFTRTRRWSSVCIKRFARSFFPNLQSSLFFIPRLPKIQVDSSQHSLTKKYWLTDYIKLKYSNWRTRRLTEQKYTYSVLYINSWVDSQDEKLRGKEETKIDQKPLSKNLYQDQCGGSGWWRHRRLGHPFVSR